jgi:hypothetical protein
VTGFSIDTSTPAPGPYRMPTDAEPRCRVYFTTPFRDCPTVCEVCPDLENYTDATMRMICCGPEMMDLLKSTVRDGGPNSDWAIVILHYIETGHQ